MGHCPLEKRHLVHVTIYQAGPDGDRSRVKSKESQIVAEDERKSEREKEREIERDRERHRERHRQR